MPKSLLRLSIVAGVLFLAAPLLFAQGHSDEAEANYAATRWKFVNTAIFAAGLGWFMWKKAPAFFNARSIDIQKAIKDATGLKVEADFRYSAIDRKMAGLGEEVKKLKAEAAANAEREHQRIREQTEAEMQHIRDKIAAETRAFEQEGIDRIRRRTAQLALQLAERRLRERFASDEPENSLGEFIHLVEQGKN